MEPSKTSWTREDAEQARRHGFELLASRCIDGGRVLAASGFKPAHVPEKVLARRALLELVSHPYFQADITVGERAVLALTADEFSGLLDYADQHWAVAWKPENRVALLNRLKAIRRAER